MFGEWFDVQTHAMIVDAYLDEAIPAVDQAGEAYRQRMDAPGRFLNERCVLRDGHSVQATDLYVAFGIWCKQAGERGVSQRAFGDRLTARGSCRLPSTASPAPRRAPRRREAPSGRWAG